MGAQATAGRARPARRATTPVLQHGFRLFFLGGAVWAVLALLHWLHMLAGMGTENSAMDPLSWHRHEMLLGYGGAVVTGFLLTAIPNWTGRLPVRGLPLLALWLVWVAARLLNLVSAHAGPWPAAIVDAGFLWLVAAVALREVAAGKNVRNLPVVLLVCLLATASTLSHLQVLGVAFTGEFAIRMALSVLALLIGLIGGRVTPSFTTNWLKKQGASALPAPFGLLDKAALAVLAAALLSWLAAPYAEISGALLLMAGLGLLLRLARWQGLRTLAEPLVWVLHLGYMWLGLALALTGLDVLLPGGLPLSVLHSLGIGAVGTMTLAVMTRASLGHTGRALTADRPTTAIYVAITAAVLLRLIEPFQPLGGITLMLAAAGWIAAFGIFVVHYGPMLVRPNPAKGG